MPSLIVEGDSYHIDDLFSELDERNYLSGFKVKIVNLDLTDIEAVLSGFWKLHMHYLHETEAGLQCSWCGADGSSWREVSHTKDCPFQQLVELEKG